VRVLYLCEGDPETSDSWSGVNRSIVTELRRRGHAVQAGDVEPAALERFLVAGQTFAPHRKRWWVRYHLSGPGFRSRSRRAASHVRGAATSADLILQIGATFQAPRIPGVPMVLYCDSNIEMARSGAASGHSEAAFLTDRELNAIRSREARVYRDADLILTMSHRARRSFMEDFAIPPERLVTIHCAPNVPLPEGPPPGSAPRATPTVLFVGRDFLRKGGDLLVEALPLVRSSVPGTRLRIVGNRPRGRWPEWVEFTGYLSRDLPREREALDRAYRTATVFSLPTRFEPFGTSFVEAMAYGLPCVGPRAWAVPEIIEDGKTGLLVPPEDPQALADALVRILSDREVARRMGAAGAVRVAEHFTWPRVIDRMLEAVTPLLATA
jgi:alpha-maltose-1-phosphate synthase